MTRQSRAKTAYRWEGSLQVCNFTPGLFVYLLIRNISCKLRFYCYALSLENSTLSVTIKVTLFPRAWRERKCTEKLCIQLQPSTCTHTTFRSGCAILHWGFHWSWPDDGPFIKIAEYCLNYYLLRTSLLSTRFWNQGKQHADLSTINLTQLQIEA